MRYVGSGSVGAYCSLCWTIVRSYLVVVTGHTCTTRALIIRSRDVDSLFIMHILPNYVPDYSDCVTVCALPCVPAQNISVI